ncbi:hypothetical protein CHELA20_52362 [Hyphomicrobiales bacterium]|nr:hypothetical protein CHELA41_22559 [Hyphomicrobiales bacterium]CAH1681664.1 hypothetical protein CHELA20_52362 [Hyphomicrobiales bacterium]
MAHPDIWAENVISIKGDASTMPRVAKLSMLISHAPFLCPRALTQPTYRLARIAFECRRFQSLAQVAP